MKTILVATDFSSSASNAAEYAAKMALAINADILLLHVYQIPVSYSEIPVPLDIDEMRKEAEKYINELKTNLLGMANGKIKIDTEVRMGVFFPHELKVVCEYINPYAVVMGSQGKTVAERLLFGSNTIFAMKYLTCPLITIPLVTKYSSIKKIGLACEFDTVVNSSIIDEIKIFVNDFNADLHVINTSEPGINTSENALEIKIMKQKMTSLKPWYHFIKGKDADESIMSFAEKNKIDILIVLPKNHGIIDKLVHKSHSKQLILHSEIPVVAIH